MVKEHEWPMRTIEVEAEHQDITHVTDDLMAKMDEWSTSSMPEENSRLDMTSIVEIEKSITEPISTMNGTIFCTKVWQV